MALSQLGQRRPRPLTIADKKAMLKVSPLAGAPAPSSMLVNVPRLVTAYYADHPDAAIVGILPLADRAHRAPSSIGFTTPRRRTCTM